MLPIPRKPALLILAALCAVSLCASSIPAAQAETPREMVGDALRRVDRDTQQLVNDVASFLQMTGRWAPAPRGADMELCQQLQSLQQQLNRFGKDNNSGKPYPILQPQVQQLQLTAGNIDRLMNQVGASGQVRSRWANVRVGLNGIAQAFYGGSGGFPWINPGYPPITPSYPSPQTADLSGSVRKIDRSTDKVVKQVAQFLQVQRRWPPPPQSPDMQLCQALQSFQQQVQRLSRDAGSNRAFPLLQAQIQQLRSTAFNVETLSNQVGVAPYIASNWADVRAGLNSLTQPLYGGYGSGLGWQGY